MPFEGNHYQQPPGTKCPISSTGQCSNATVLISPSPILDSKIIQVPTNNHTNVPKAPITSSQQPSPKVPHGAKEKVPDNPKGSNPQNPKEKDPQNPNEIVPQNPKQ
ncbi:hypothetical protein HAX54_027459 [Datura stramonium]|uniref:Uncharacterized protein n=1 Tax=Datura stramonium TaxID=4076 RepID=A0ABS8S8S4_DATST|nr:hypothetical protein [Datura stramonium]